jgi:hypothetical protein
VALFESELSGLALSVTDKGVILKFDGDGRARTATVKRRAESSKRPRMPAAPDSSGYLRVSVKSFESLLRQVSCSALVRETKTDEDKKWNQIHFYPDGHVTSNARFYATVAHMEGLELDFSMVSSDIPLVRAFCSKSKDDILIGSDSRTIRFADPSTGSWMSLAKVSTERPSLSVPPESHSSSVSFLREDFRKSVKWCMMALEGTPRITRSVSAGQVRRLTGTTELSSFPAELEGRDFSSDLPVKVLSTVSDHLDDGPMRALFGNPAMAGVVEITQPGGATSSRHFVKGMKVR